MRSGGGESGLRGRGGTGGAEMTKDGIGDDVSLLFRLAGVELPDRGRGPAGGDGVEMLLRGVRSGV